MQFTTVGKEKIDMYLKSEKLVHSMWKWEKTGYLAILSLTNNVAAIWREKSGSCDLETKICSSQLLGARKQIMTCI